MSEISIIKDYLKDKRVIYIDDDVDLKSCIEELFISFSSHIQFFTSAKSFLDNYTLDKYDLIITDIEMPELNGIDIVKKIREIDKNTPIIIVSAYPTKDYLITCLNLNVQGFIEKPIDSKKFSSTFKNLIDNEKKITIDSTNNIIYFPTKNIISTDTSSFYLHYKEKRLLDILLKFENKIITYENIESAIWSEDDKMMTIEALRTLIKNLRKKLGKNIIKNISGIGYKLNTK